MLGVIVGSGPYAYRRDDGLWVLPNGGRGYGKSRSSASGRPAWMT
jgi:predicted NUDIX family NTP pyrophosphohydrolase